MELRNKNVLVIGLARTGVECARFLSKRGAMVTVSDQRPESALKAEIESLRGLPIDYRLGGEDRHWLANADWVLASPGVPAANPLLEEARVRGISVLSEIELAYRFIGAPLVAITGTNGKSTTTTLIGEMFKRSGANVFVGGNLGAPMIGFASGSWQWGVVEISSFQLEWVEEFRPHIALLLNLTEDHLDRYPDFSSYCRAKERIFASQTKENIAILNRDDPLVWAVRERVSARTVSFGCCEVERGVFTASDAIVWRDGCDEETYPLARIKIRGVHNIENMMAAVAAAKCAGIGSDTIQTVLEEFAGLEHRVEFVRELAGIKYYNDSKGTNVGAVVKSLASFSEPVVLLAGGVDKGGHYGALEDLVRRKVRRLILFGAAKQILTRALGHLTDTVVVDTLEAAVHDAARVARPGDVVLLSPACSSFDQFRNYAERGRTFKRLVHAL